MNLSVFLGGAARVWIYCRLFLNASRRTTELNIGVYTVKRSSAPLTEPPLSQLSLTASVSLTNRAALGNVINALTDSGKRHVPYRDSKLTRLLQVHMHSPAHALSFF